MNAAVLPFEEEVRTLGDYLAMVRRRKALIFWPALLVFLAALAVALFLPARYQSLATILIEEQDVPRDFVQSTITNYADQQIQIINRRLMTVETLSGIADKFGLYRNDEGEAPPATELLKRFSQDMAMNLVSAEVVDPRSGRPGEATIAFTLSFVAGDSSTAQKVTNEIVTLFLNENLRARDSQAASTAQFLAEEARLLQDELQGLEAQLAAFKKANEGSLPELYQFNLSVVERTQREKDDLEFRLNELAKREIEVQSQLVSISPTAPRLLPGGTTFMNDGDRLDYLRSERERLQSRYQAAHPDVRALDLEIAELEQRQTGTPEAAADNPAYLLLHNQLQSLVLERNTLQARLGELGSRIAQYEGYIRRAPDVEKDYQALLRDYNTANQKYQELKAKQREAELSRNLERERKGQRFTLIEPPSLPIDPVKPNRPAIVLIGFIMALGAGFGLAYLRESTDKAVHGEKALEKILGGPLLAVVPYIENIDDHRQRQRSWLQAAMVLLLAVIAVLVLVHVVVRPLDVIFFQAMQWFGLN